MNESDDSAGVPKMNKVTGKATSVNNNSFMPHQPPINSTATSSGTSTSKDSTHGNSIASATAPASYRGRPRSEPSTTSASKPSSSPRNITATTDATGSTRSAFPSDDEDNSNTTSMKSATTKSSLQDSQLSQAPHAASSRLEKINETSAVDKMETDNNNNNNTVNSFFGHHHDDAYNDQDVHNFGTFMNDDDDDVAATAFPQTNFSSTPTATATSAFLDTSFDAAFASSDVPFDSFFNPSSTTAATTTATRNQTFAPALSSSIPFTNAIDDDAFNMDIISEFQGFSLESKDDKKDKVIYDHTPFTNVPKMVPPTMILQQKMILKQHFHCAPIQNPANGNIIFISSSSSSSPSLSNIPVMTIHEVDPHRNYISVSSIPLLSIELRRVVAAKYHATIQSIQKTWTLTMGLAQPTTPSMDTGTTTRSTGVLREHLAAIIDLRVYEATTTMRLVVMWERNTTSNRFELFHITTPPSGGDFASDLSTLQVSDGLLFVGGASPKGSCVFISKPSFRSEAWSANFVTGMGSVLYMSVSMTKPYLVVALADKSITVWTYQSALRSTVHNIMNKNSNETAATDQSSSTTASSKRWLYPLCRLHYNDVLSTVIPEYPGTDQDDTTMDSKNDAGYCTHMAWLPVSSSVSSLSLLSVTFDNALVIYNVELPLIKDGAMDKEYRPFPEPTQSTVIAATPILSPIVAKRWKGNFEHSAATWFQYGSVTDTCIAIVLHDTAQQIARVLLYAVHYPLRSLNPLNKRDVLLPCRTVSSLTIPKSEISFPSGLLHSLNSLISYSKCTLSSITLSTVKPESTNMSPAYFLSHPITSNPSGLSSTGEPFMSDTQIDSDGVLFIYTTIHCDRESKNNDATHLHCSLPQRRFWLCRAIAGDTIEALSDEVKEESGFGESYQVLGGANAQLICELNDNALKGLSPVRIIRCWRRKVCAILFRCALGSVSNTTSQPLSLVADTIVLVDFSGESPLVIVSPGRDIAFFPDDDANTAHGFILSVDGSSVTIFDFNRTTGLVTTSSFRPLLGVSVDSEYIDCHRILIFSDDTKLNMAILGTRSIDHRVCFVAGDVGDVAEAASTGYASVLPNLSTDRSFFFSNNEDVFAIIGLQGDGSGYRNFAVTTSKRILILSSSLSVSAESLHDRTSGLSPIGSFAVCYASNDKIRYLCCLDQTMSTGVVASLGRLSHDCSRFALLGVRPDRLIFYSATSSSTLCEPNQNSNVFSLPLPSTRPALLLEPMIANAVCIGQKKRVSTPILHHIIEKFGRKVSSIVHGEKEGIGSFGAGITPACFAILRNYELTEAASWLLTGTVKFDISANTKLLPSWIPITPKSMGALNSDAILHLLSNGDTYFSDYIKSPGRNVAARLPRQTDPSTLLSREYAQQHLRAGKQLDAIKMLDVSGTESSENLSLLVSLTMAKTTSANSLSILQSLSGSIEYGKSKQTEHGKASTLFAALAEWSSISYSSEMKDQDAGKDMSRWVSILAPSLQRSKLSSRSRQSLMKGELVDGSKTKISSDPVWNTQCNESKHIWNEGPQNEKECVLLLDNVEDWLGRRRPLIFGKEGASAIRDRGEKTLADILNQEDDSFGGVADDTANVKGDGWIDGVGEGRLDEANLSAYFRMSEGEDRENTWRITGLDDLSPFQNKARVICDPMTAELQHSTSSVDEGETGKVKSLFDLVFTAPGRGIISGLLLPAPRGSSLDVGVLHFSDREVRKKSTIEFWFYLPEAEKGHDEMILIRRSWGSHADDIPTVAISSNRQCVLWELALRPTGEFEFRTCGGSSLSSSNMSEDAAKSRDTSKEEVTEASCLAMFGRWNHVCLVLNSKGLKHFDCNTTLYVKGMKALNGITRMIPLDDDSEHWNESRLHDSMRKSSLLFGLNHCVGFRLTELRVWACERSAEDIQSFLYEYLNAAEQKKKFKVKITNKSKVGTTLNSQKGFFGNKKNAENGQNRTLSSIETVFSLKPQKSNAQIPSSRSFDATNDDGSATPNIAVSTVDLHVPKDTSMTEPIDQQGNPVDVVEHISNDKNKDDDDDVAVTLWDSAVPLSQQLRPSAAAALIRGPPATRHYGGNRGGLPDFSGVDRIGVGGIAICGSEKTIVFRDNEDPPAVTYPIGASGAVVSDQMDEDGSEFLCCFLAKEGRMVVFELRSRTVVVELQMTTKLNFWRYLPPEAASNSLCYMLITPVGGFHWKPLEESPRPHQVWKRGPDLEGKKVVNYEEGGSNGGENDELCSRVGLITVTRSSGNGSLEGWLLPISGDSKPKPLPSNILGACLCQPLYVDYAEPFLPILVTVESIDGQLTVNAVTIKEPKDGSISLADVVASQVIEDFDAGGSDFVPPALAMGPLPEALCVSLSNIVVVILRRKGLVAAFEYEENELNIIAMEFVDHFVIDAVMRYSSDIGGAEIVMLLSDSDNGKDGRIVSFCFRSTD